MATRPAALHLRSTSYDMCAERWLEAGAEEADMSKLSLPKEWYDALGVDLSCSKGAPLLCSASDRHRMNWVQDLKNDVASKPL